jgi:hypothetical protein
MRYGAALFLLGVAGCATASESATSTSADTTPSYTATVTTTPGTPAVGAGTPVDVVVRDASGATVTQFDLVHTMPMHFIAVSSDLNDFIHIHPTLGTDGHFSTNATFGLAEPYSVFMEYEPTGTSDETLSRANVTPAGAVSTPAHLRSSGSYSGMGARTASGQGTTVKLEGLSHGMLMSNTTAHVVVDFTDTATGAPINDLTNWLGMPAHAILVSQDLKNFVHVHGMPEAGGTSTPSGPLGIDMTIPEGGLYKMFLQFQRGTTLTTIPFVVNVMQSSAPPPTCATMTCPPGQSCMIMGGAPMCM